MASTSGIEGAKETNFVRRDTIVSEGTSVAVVHDDEQVRVGKLWTILFCAMLSPIEPVLTEGFDGTMVGALSHMPAAKAARIHAHLAEESFALKGITRHHVSHCRTANVTRAYDDNF